MTDIATIEAALAAATPGPWKLHDIGYEFEQRARLSIDAADGDPIGVAVWGGTVESEADAVVIANAPTWLAELLEDAKRWRAIKAAVTPSTALTLAWDKDADGNPVVRLSHGLRRITADSVDEAVEKMGEGQ